MRFAVDNNQTLDYCVCMIVNATANETKGATMKHSARIKAERNYKAALKVWKSFEMISADVATKDDEARFMQADKALTLARREMCKMQTRYPTRSERKEEWHAAAFAWQN